FTALRSLAGLLVIRRSRKALGARASVLAFTALANAARMYDRSLSAVRSLPASTSAATGVRQSSTVIAPAGLLQSFGCASLTCFCRDVLTSRADVFPWLSNTSQ